MPGTTLLRLCSIAALPAAWWLISTLFAPPLLPPLGEVVIFIWRESASGEMLLHFAATILRVLAAFTVAMAVGLAVGMAMGANRTANAALEPWLILLLNAPALVVLVLAYIWIGLNEVAAIAAVAINKIPNVVVTIREGMRSTDRALAEVATVYRFSRRRLVFDLWLPQLQPYIAAAGRSGLALIWKIVLVVELLGRSNGVGFQIGLHFQLFNVTAILGYTLVFVLLMLVLENVVVQPFETRARRWRLKPI